jgi:hypothetical protein
MAGGGLLEKMDHGWPVMEELKSTTFEDKPDNRQE